VILQQAGFTTAHRLRTSRFRSKVHASHENSPFPTRIAMIRSALAIVLLLAAADSQSLAAEDHGDPAPVTVTLSNGRSVHGFVDSRTSETELWIRRIEPSVVLRNGFEWGHILAIESRDKKYSPNEFRLLAPQLGTQLTKEFWGSFWTMTIPVDSDARSLEPTAQPSAPVSNAAPGPVGPPVLLPPYPQPQPLFENPVPPAPVASLHIDARLSNWDNDPEPDGLLVAVTPFDPAGRPVATSGQIQFTLIGQNISSGNYLDGQTYGASRSRPLFPELVRQSYSVHPADFASGPAIYMVPFRTWFPQFNDEIGPQGVLTARLLIPGQGLVQASDDRINLCPPNWVRDQRQQYFGGRYFPQERVRQHPQ
jgi:hypothetical protein